MATNVTTKIVNTNVNDYARPVTKKGYRKNMYPFDRIKVKPVKVTIKQSSNQ